MRKYLIIALVVAAVLGAIAALAGYWIVFSANTPEYEGERSVKIPSGTSFDSAVDSLTAAGVLEDEQTFTWMATATGWGGQIKAGHYLIPEGASNHDILQKLRRGLQDPVPLTIPPGTRPEVVAAVAGRDMAFEPADFSEALRDTALAASLGTDTTHLFGYMLPETYHFYWPTSAETVVKRIKEEFDAFYERELAAAAEKHDLTKDEMITLAGIIEWETHVAEERPRVAGVYLNRLDIGMKLDADPTIQYILMQREGQKRRVLYDDLEISSPYNTYRNAGLPPGPITNPSPASLRAIANAEDHDYFYFVATGDGGHTFSRTLREHNNAANRYHRLMRERRAEQRRAERERQAEGSG